MFKDAEKGNKEINIERTEEALKPRQVLSPQDVHFATL